MSDTSSNTGQADAAGRSAPAYGTAPVDASSTVPSGASAQAAWAPSNRTWLVLLSVISALALFLAMAVWQKLANVQEALARQSADANAVSIEARTMARTAQEVAREAAARQSLMDAKLSEVSLQRGQLDELMQSLSRSRDENLVVDIESALRLAQQQAQLTGSAEPLITTLKSAELRLGRAAQPRLVPLQRAIVRDLDKVKALSLSDMPSMLLRLDELVRLVDDAPLLNKVGKSVEKNIDKVVAKSVEKPAEKPTSKSTATPAKSTTTVVEPEKNWWQNGIDKAWEQTRSLLRVSRIDQPEAALLAPEQGFFLRENTKLKLLNARLGLLARQADSVRSDLAAAAAAFNKYYDGSAKTTQQALELVAQLQIQMKSTELPRLDDSFAALATASAGK